MLSMWSPVVKAIKGFLQQIVGLSAGPKAQGTLRIWAGADL